MNTDRNRYITLCVSIFVIVFVTVFGVNKSFAATPSCTSKGTTAGFGYVDSSGNTELSVQGSFEEFKCMRGGNKVWITKADTPDEVVDLTKWAHRGWSNGSALCETGSTTAFISSVDEDAAYKAGPKNVQRYNKWIRNYAGRHNCTFIRGER